MSVETNYPGPYLLWARKYLDGRLTAREFHDYFLPAFKKDENVYPPEIRELLNEMFGFVECYEPDPVLNAKLRAKDPTFTVDDAGLRRGAERFVSGIDTLFEGPNEEK